MATGTVDVMVSVWESISPRLAGGGVIYMEPQRGRFPPDFLKWSDGKWFRWDSVQCRWYQTLRIPEKVFPMWSDEMEEKAAA